MAKRHLCHCFGSARRNLHGLVPGTQRPCLHHVSVLRHDLHQRDHHCDHQQRPDPLRNRWCHAGLHHDVAQQLLRGSDLLTAVGPSPAAAFDPWSPSIQFPALNGERPCPCLERLGEIHTIPGNIDIQPENRSCTAVQRLLRRCHPKVGFSAAQVHLLLALTTSSSALDGG